MTRGAFVLAAVVAPTCVIACNALLGIADVPADDANDRDAAIALDAGSLDDSSFADAFAIDVASFDAAILDAPALGDVVRTGNAACELADPTSCGGPPRGCLYDYADGGVACGTMGTSEASCSNDPQCAPGLFCLFGTCTRWCRFGIPSDCDDAGSCAPNGSPVVVDGTTYGYCS